MVSAGKASEPPNPIRARFASPIYQKVTICQGINKWLVSLWIQVPEESSEGPTREGGVWGTRLYLNVVEWGPGVYGAESACRYYYRTSALNIDGEQSARLAAILPLPLKRRPDRMNHYSGLILERMRQLG